MAQDRFINITLDPSASKKADIENHRHGTSSGAAASAGDLTLSFDTSKVTSQTILNSCLIAVVAAAAGSLKP